MHWGKQREGGMTLLRLKLFMAGIHPRLQIAREKVPSTHTHIHTAKLLLSCNTCIAHSPHISNRCRPISSPTRSTPAATPCAGCPAEHQALPHSCRACEPWPGWVQPYPTAPRDEEDGGVYNWHDDGHAHEEQHMPWLGWFTLYAPALTTGPSSMAVI